MTEDGELVARLRDGEKRALARAITRAETDEAAGWRLVAEAQRQPGDAAIVGITGPPGAGKSTLISALVAVRRSQGRDVGVLSVDPSSPFTRGAVLGDRIRLTRHFLDDRVFIRSMGSRGALGGLSGAALQAVLLMDAAGKDDVFLETVGVGQAEVDVIDRADTVVLVLVPGSGDAVQAIKAGVMEIPDVIVVNKADLPAAATLLQQVRSSLALGPNDRDGWSVPVLAAQASDDVGIVEVTEAIDAHRAHLAADGRLARRRAARLRTETIALASRRFARRIERALAEDPALVAELAAVERFAADPATVADRLLDHLSPR